MQVESAIPCFLSSLREAGIELPQGVRLLDRQARLSSEDPAVSRGRGPHSANASGSEGFRARLGSTAIPRSVDPSWMDENVNAGASGSCASAPDPHLRSVSFTEASDRSADDAASVTSEKPPPQEGLRVLLRLLYHYCPSAASEAQTHTLRSCDFKCLFAQETQPRTEEPSPVLFHRVAELWAEAQQRCRSAAEAGKLQVQPYLIAGVCLPLALTHSCAVLLPLIRTCLALLVLVA